MVTRDQVMQALEAVVDPELRRNVVDLRMVRDLQVSDTGHASFAIALTTPGCPLKQSFQDQVDRALSAVEGITGVEMTFTVMSIEEKESLRGQLREGRQYRTPGISLPDTCRVIAVTSGKGGVGKSTLTANLAVAMAKLGKEVGVLDADVYGYSIPQMLGIRQRPVTVDRMIVPPVAHDVRVMSIGFFLDEDAPVMWRGPMLHRALEQFLGDVHWGDVEYLFVDMPPGTGDVAISLGQLLPRAEVLVVTTPQVAAQTVAQRSAVVAGKMDQVVIGAVENMADAEGAPGMFGRGGGQVLAESIGVPLLATIPLDASVRESGDAGTPLLTLDGATPVARQMTDLARAIEEIAPPRRPAPEPAQRIKKPLAML